jgi:hypothetical protein
MPMSRQDYVAFAEIVRDLSRLYPNGGVNSESVAARMAELFADDNERFDAVRFFDACGINGKLAVEVLKAERGTRPTTMITTSGRVIDLDIIDPVLAVQVVSE